MSHPLEMFDWVPIVNLPERTDRRRAMARQIARVGGFDGQSIGFFDAVRPADRGEFPSIGARGCFMSHLTILRSARERGVRQLLILEDDLDFSSDFLERGTARLAQLAASPWDMFYGVYDLPDGGVLDDDGPVEAMRPIRTTPFVAFRGEAVPRAIAFLEGVLGRPGGSPDYGPMHVDGAYSVFRMQNPDIRTFAAAPPLGHQRSSRSDISDKTRFFDRVPALRAVAELGRRARAGMIGR